MSFKTRAILIFIAFLLVLAIGVKFKIDITSFEDKNHQLNTTLYQLEALLHEHIYEVNHLLNSSHINNDKLVRVFKQTHQAITHYNNQLHLYQAYPKTQHELSSYLEKYMLLERLSEQFMQRNTGVKNSLGFLINQLKNSNEFNTDYQRKYIEVISSLFILQNNINNPNSINKKLIQFFENYPVVSEKTRLNLKHIQLLVKEIPLLKTLYKEITQNQIIDKHAKMHNMLLLDINAIKRTLLYEYLIILISFILTFIMATLFVYKHKKSTDEVSRLENDRHQVYYYDKLTGMLNRNMFNTVLNDDDKVIVLLVDIVEFNKINSIVGYDGGDDIIIQISKLFKQWKILFYRIGIDQFATIVAHKNISIATQMANEIITDIEEHIFNYKNIEVPVTFQIGISEFPPYIKNSELAIKHGKNSYDKIFCYDQSLDDRKSATDNIKMFSVIKNAIADNKVRPFFQQIIDVKTKKIVKYEALIRLIDMNGKIISPFFFLDVAKNTKLYPSLTKLVIQKAIGFAKERNISVSINISFQDLMNSDTLNFISLILQVNSDITHLLTFEMLESEEIENYDTVKKFVSMIKGYGCELAIDDFGSGFSNFNHIFELLPDIIKIDGSLIKNITENRNSQHVVESILFLAKKANIKTVAEFVENEKIDAMIESLGVDMGQGYYYAPPKDLL